MKALLLLGTCVILCKFLLALARSLTLCSIVPALARSLALHNVFTDPGLFTHTALLLQLDCCSALVPVTNEFLDANADIFLFL